MLYESELRRPSLTIAMYGMEAADTGLISEWQLLEQYFDNPWILDEAATHRAKQLILEFWGAIKKGMSAVGAAVSDPVGTMMKGAKAIAPAAAKVMKTVAEKGQEFIMSAGSFTPDYIIPQE